METSNPIRQPPQASFLQPPQALKFAGIKSKKMNQPQIIAQILHTLPSGAVTKNNLRQAVQAHPNYKDHSPRNWQIAVNEAWEIERHNFVKIYKEPDGNPIAVFINQQPTRGALQVFSLIGEHFTATPEYLRTRCTRIKPDQAPELVSYLLNNYAANYHTETPILL